ncbi:MAG: hypothetical protein IPM50_09160 [Acidobacteriota bacterium]|nr:MAG: hypothetical protein IPM50_09160 [Acidobacteriota bacterium]
MPFDNTAYIYDHLPSRYRREDRDLFLRRFLSFAGVTMDEWDGTFDAFWSSINPETAPAKWIEFWLLVLFGWSWFPWWFTLLDKRRIYGNFARHLGRRGTRRGIELWLADFGIAARVHTKTLPWGEFVWGEPAFAITRPLHLIIEILFVRMSAADMCVTGEGAWGEAFYARPRPVFSKREIVELVRYVQPLAQEVVIVWGNGSAATADDGEVYWRQISW